MQKNNNNNKCPACNKNFTAGNFMPFCSKHCQISDLGDWLSERNALPSEDPLTYEDIEKIELTLRQN